MNENIAKMHANTYENVVKAMTLQCLKVKYCSTLKVLYNLVKYTPNVDMLRVLNTELH